MKKGALKSTYRIYNKVSGNYITNGSKRVWLVPGFVANVIRDRIKYNSMTLDDFEIHEFPVVTMNVIDAKEFFYKIDVQQKEAADKKLKSAEGYRKRHIQDQIDKLQKEIEMLTNEIKIIR